MAKKVATKKTSTPKVGAVNVQTFFKKTNLSPIAKRDKTPVPSKYQKYREIPKEFLKTPPKNLSTPMDTMHRVMDLTDFRVPRDHRVELHSWSVIVKSKLQLTPRKPSTLFNIKRRPL